MRYFIDAKKKGLPLTEEEEAEREKMIKELYGKVNPDDVIDPSLYYEEGNLLVNPEQSDGEVAAQAEIQSYIRADYEAVNETNLEATPIAEGIDAFAQAEAVKISEKIADEHSDITE